MLSALRRQLPMSARAEATELLDSGGLSAAEVDANLADLARLNRLPGGTSASLVAIERLTTSDDAPRVLDVGAGGGDQAVAFGRRGWQTVAVDTNPAVLRVARRTTAREPLVTVIEADGRSLPFDDRAFDVVHCSLLVHHLAPEEAAALLREMGRVARRGVVVNDLRRGIVPLVATAVPVLVLGRSRVTRADGIASARRAYTLDELDGLLGVAGLARAWRSPGWLPRVVTAAVPA